MNNYMLSLVGFAVLDLFKSIITKGVQKDSVFTLVIYTVRYILVNYGSWKYKSKHEPWEILSKVYFSPWCLFPSCITDSIHVFIFLQSIKDL